MERKELGRIQKITYGFGGYQDAQFGLSVTLGGAGWGVADFHGGWAIKPSDHADWTVGDQDKWFAETARHILRLLKEAKATDVSGLLGKPIEATFDGNLLKSWRILTEVL